MRVCLERPTELFSAVAGPLDRGRQGLHGSVRPAHTAKHAARIHYARRTDERIAPARSRRSIGDPPGLYRARRQYQRIEAARGLVTGPELRRPAPAGVAGWPAAKQAVCRLCLRQTGQGITGTSYTTP